MYKEISTKQIFLFLMFGNWRNGAFCNFFFGWPLYHIQNCSSVSISI